MTHRHLLFLCPLLLGLIISCAPAPAAETAAQPGPASPTAAATLEVPAAPDPSIPTPALTQSEELLTGPGEGPPDVFVVREETPVEELAAFLRTTPAQIVRVNPDLPDPVQADTLLTVPLDYVTGEGESLASVAEDTGLPEQILAWANPDEAVLSELSVETRLLMPRLYIVYSETPLTAIAEELGMQPTTLLRFNPTFQETSIVQPGEVLVVPFG